MQSIGGLVSHQSSALHGAAEGLEALASGHTGTRIEKRTEIMRDLLRLHQHDVVLARALHLVSTHIRTSPMNAVVRIGAAGHLVIAAILVRHRLAPVVGAQFVADAHDADIPAEAALPRRIKLERDAFIPRSVQLEMRAIELVDQELIDEQLAAAADVDRISSTGKSTGKQSGDEECGVFHVGGYSNGATQPWPSATCWFIERTREAVLPLPHTFFQSLPGMIRCMNSLNKGTVKAVSPWLGLQIMPLAMS